MNIFYDFNTENKAVNISKVREIDIARKSGALYVTFDNGDSEVYSVHGDVEDAAIQFGRTIVQFIPCAAPTYNIYKDGEESYFHERVEFFALCADGEIRSLANADGHFELADEALNFIGFFGEDRLHEYPEKETISG